MKKALLVTAWVMLPGFMLPLVGCGSNSNTAAPVAQQQGLATQQSATAGVKQGDGGKQAVKTYYDQEAKRREVVRQRLEKRTAAIQRERALQNTNAGQ